MAARDAKRHDEEERLLAWLSGRSLVRDGVSKWGLPAIRTIEPGQEPQNLMDANALQRRFVACAHGTPCPGDDLCASWVEQAFSRLGFGVVLGDAARLYDDYCHYDRTSDLRVGMIVAVPAHPYTSQGLAHGHVGLYAGDGTVMDAVTGKVRRVPVWLWLSAYGIMAEPRWGWLGHIALDA